MTDDRDKFEWFVRELRNLSEDLEEDADAGRISRARIFLSGAADKLERLEGGRKPDLPNNLEKFIDELEAKASKIRDDKTFVVNAKNRAAHLLSAAADRLESMQNDLDYLKQRATELAAEKARLEGQLEAASVSSKQKRSSCEAGSGSFEAHEGAGSRDISSNKEDGAGDKASLSEGKAGLGYVKQRIRELARGQAHLEARLEDLEEATDVDG